MSWCSRRRFTPHARAFPSAMIALVLGCSQPAWAQASDGILFNDVHFHLTNYVQKGPPIEQFLETMGTNVGRVALFGIPLQQTWSYENSGDYAPSYYLQSDAPLYYYSFTDAYIAMAYLSLAPEEQARFDPMITGFNPADMYAVDHIRRALELFPGVFSGIGEFTIHKEFVSSKVAGDIASLTDPALDRILDFAAEVGLVVLLHSDIDMPFAKEGAEPVFLMQMKDLLRRHPQTTIIWAHTGLGRVVHPVRSQATAGAAERSPRHIEILEEILDDRRLRHVHFDISWDEVAKYVVATPENTRVTADLIKRHADRFLFGTDEVAPPDQPTYLRVYEQYQPLWAALGDEASAKVRKGNYERLFDAARGKVRAWERDHVGRPPAGP
jgi:predicted TIM-barrel fold metal-dependent hydrolase